MSGRRLLEAIICVGNVRAPIDKKSSRAFERGVNRAVGPKLYTHTGSVSPCTSSRRPRLEEAVFPGVTK